MIKMFKSLYEVEEIANKALQEYFGRKEKPVILVYAYGTRDYKTYIDVRPRPYILRITENRLDKTFTIQIANIEGQIKKKMKEV